MTDDAEEIVADYEHVTITREPRAGEPDLYHVEDPLEQLKTFESKSKAELYADVYTVVGHVGCPHRTALHHLNALEEDGQLESQTVGRAKVWRVVETDDADSGDDRADELREVVCDDE